MAIPVAPCHVVLDLNVQQSCRPAGNLLASCRLEGIFFGGWKGEVWIQKGKPASQASSSNDKAWQFKSLFLARDF